MAYTKIRTRKIIADNLKKIAILERSLGNVREKRNLLSGKISPERRSEIAALMLELHKENKRKKNSAVAWVQSNIVKNQDEWDWMFYTSSIFYFSNFMSNLKKKIDWMKQIAILDGQKRKKVYLVSKGDWTAYFCFLLNIEVVRDQKDADYIFYKLDQNVKNIAECVDESHKNPTKIIACAEKENLGFLIKMLRDNGVSCFNNLDQTIDYISKL